MMESWICGTPNLVNGRCAVTKAHCIVSNGGLYYENYDEFDACLSYIIRNPSIIRQLADNGRKYVLKNYDWDIVLSKYLEIFQVI